MNETSPAPAQPTLCETFFSYGFRPFFTAAGFYAILPLLVWITSLSGHLPTPEHLNMQLWHGHEMFFGFVSAAVSGFLLTAIPNWTGTPPVTGGKLKLLFGFWLLGRAAFWLALFDDSGSFVYLLFLDLGMMLMQVTLVTRTLLRTKNKRNFIFIGLMSTLGIANLLTILELTAITEDTARIGAGLAINTMMLMIAVVGGRVTPNFTRGHLRNQGTEAALRAAESIQTFPWIERIAIGLLIANLVSDLFFMDSHFSGAIVLAAVIAHTIRFGFWNSSSTFNAPVVWILHLGYAWFIVALLLKGIEPFFDISYHLFLHAFTLGAIGTFIIAIMSRASLGHTGRDIKASGLTLFAYVSISLAAVTRLWAALLPGDHYMRLLEASSGLWILAFASFLVGYLPILLKPRL